MDHADNQVPEKQRGAGELVSNFGAAKQAEPTDPMDLVGTMVPGGDVEFLARCFVEEYAAMGYDGEQILELFRQPQYAGVHPVYRAKGERAVRTLIEEVLAECGVFRVSESIIEKSPPRRSKLIQIEMPGTPGGDEHP